MLSRVSVLVMVLLFDQVSKYFFASMTILNQGVGFGFGAELATQQNTILLLLVVIVASWYVARCFWQRSEIATGLFFGGAFSNLFDRVLVGGVRDWLPIPFTSVSNNLADWAIFLALTWMAWRTFADREGRRCAAC